MLQSFIDRCGCCGCNGIEDASLQQHLRRSRWVVPVLPPCCLRQIITIPPPRRPASPTHLENLLLPDLRTSGLYVNDHHFHTSWCLMCGKQPEMHVWKLLLSVTHSLISLSHHYPRHTLCMSLSLLSMSHLCLSSSSPCRVCSRVHLIRTIRGCWGSCWTLKTPVAAELSVTSLRPTTTERRLTNLNYMLTLGRTIEFVPYRLSPDCSDPGDLSISIIKHKN